MDLKILKGGKLQRTDWVYDKTVKKGSYVSKDVTSNAVRHLFDYCELEDGVTLKDVFLLLNTELDIFDAVIGNWCKEIVQEGLTPSSEAYVPNKYDPDGIEYLELYKCLYTDGTEKKSYGTAHPNFHGVGYELTEDKMASWSTPEKPDVEWPKGSRIPWGISFTASNVLIDLPLKLDPTLKVYNDDHTAPVKDYCGELATYPGIAYTLGDILYGVIWELSWNGAPESRKERAAELFAAANEVEQAAKEGRLDEVTVPAESLFNDIDNSEDSE